MRHGQNHGYGMKKPQELLVLESGRLLQEI